VARGIKILFLKKYKGGLLLHYGRPPSVVHCQINRYALPYKPRLYVYSRMFKTCGLPFGPFTLILTG